MPAAYPGKDYLNKLNRKASEATPVLETVCDEYVQHLYNYVGLAKDYRDKCWTCKYRLVRELFPICPYIYRERTREI